MVWHGQRGGHLLHDTAIAGMCLAWFFFFFPSFTHSFALHSPSFVRGFATVLSSRLDGIVQGYGNCL